MRWCVVLILALVSLVSAERIWEQGRDQRVHGHHRDEFVDEPPVEEDDISLHGGIPVVEDDVPEWVKLTFADKFIAMGESEFIQLAEDVVEKPEDIEEDSYRKSKHHHHHHHKHSHEHESDNDEEYEYVYSDEEGFQYDPSRDVLVNDPHTDRSKSAPSAASPAKRRNNDIQIDDEGTDAEEERQAELEAEDEDADLVRAVKAHRDMVDKDKPKSGLGPASSSGVPISVPVNDGAPADAVSMLEVESNGSKSHARGSRRARLQSQRQINKHQTAFSTAPPMASPHLAAHAFRQIPARYSSNGRASLNANDPRFKDHSVISFLEEDTDTLKLVHEDSATVAKNHREWLAKHPDEKKQEEEEEAKLPSIKKHMYSNGIPVADWEVGYVDNVLKQFGY